MQTVRNSGTVKATAAGVDGFATAILDKSGGLTLVENSGTIAATGAAAPRSVAIDLRTNTSDTIIRQVAGAAGALAPSIVGDVLFGADNDTLSLAGKSTMAGKVDFGGGNDTLTITENSRFTGTLLRGERLALNVASGTLLLIARSAVALSLARCAAARAAFCLRRHPPPVGCNPSSLRQT